MATPTRNNTRTAPPDTSGVSQGEDVLGSLKNAFQGVDYASTPALGDLLSQFERNYGSAQGTYQGGATQFAKDALTEVNGYVNQFRGMFKDSVGRDPTADETDNFIKTILVPDQAGRNVINPSQLNQETKGFLSDFYKQAAVDQAQKTLEQQANAAVAPGSAFDTWSKSYADVPNQVEQSLLDYQSKLMEKIRPQLITSLQSQGLLDSGALNYAFAGASKDLADTASNYVSGLKGQTAQDIANQKYSLASAPTTYKLNTTMGNVPNLINQGTNALQNVWQNYMSEKAFKNQKSLLDEQYANQPSLLQQYGGLILGGMAGGLGQRLGSKMI